MFFGLWARSFFKIHQLLRVSVEILLHGQRSPCDDSESSTNLPFVRADAEEWLFEINQRFREVYGWSDEQLIGQSLGLILPPSFRDSHHAGLLAFQLAEV